MKTVSIGLVAACATAVLAYDNGAPSSRLPPVGWSSWVALGPDAQHPIFDFCSEASVKLAVDAYVSPALGLVQSGFYKHFHLDDCERSREEFCCTNGSIMHFVFC